MSERRRLIRCFAALALVAAVAAPVRAADGAQALVEASDRIRNPAQPFRVTARLVEYRSGKPHDTSSLRLYSKASGEGGRFRNLASYLEPTADVGKALLMQDRIMWFYDPASSASVRVSPQQRLVGQASIGDVMTVDFTRDYKAATVGEETIPDADNKPRAVVHLNLVATSDAAIYSRIEYWVEKDSSFPVKGRFYADSGRALKVAYWRKPAPQLGMVRPTEVVILDEVDPTVLTRLSFSDYHAMEIPDSWFQRDWLSHLQAAP